MNALVNVTPQYAVSDMERIAGAIAGSKLFGIQNVDQALALCLVAQAEGRHPASAAQDYHIIQGRPAKKSDAMLRDFLSSGGKVEWHTLDDTKADATFSHSSGGSVRIDWTLARASAAGLATPMWKKYPRQMLRSRVVSEGVRTVYPMATSGMYVPEEVQDFASDQPTTVHQVDDDLPATAQPRKSIAQARKDGDYERMTEGLRACRDEASLKAWGAENADEIGSLPAGWQKELRNEFAEMLQRYKADPMGVKLDLPAEDSADAWEAWLDAVTEAISGAQTPAEVVEVQRVNCEGIGTAAMVLEGVTERVATISETRLAELEAVPA